MRQRFSSKRPWPVGTRTPRGKSVRMCGRSGKLSIMTLLGLLLAVVIPALWIGIVVSGRLFGRAADQGMYMGMASPSDPDQKESIERGLRQQGAQGRFASVLLRWWPLVLASLVAGVIVLATS